MSNPPRNWPFPARPLEYPVAPPAPKRVPVPRWKPTGNEPAAPF